MKPFRWTNEEDEILRSLAEARTSLEEIAARLQRAAPEIMRRGYTIGLPLKWHKATSE